MQLQNIGLALSGGGIRATIFHLGLLKWLAKNGMLENVRRVSSVSGGSLCVGLVYSHNNLKWPTSKEFITNVLPSIECTLLKNDLQLSALRKILVSPHYWSRKAVLIARLLESKWGIHGKISELTGDVTWYVNCTTYETGKRFRFCRNNMGDYMIGYVNNPQIPLSEVMSASAGFPIFIGPYDLNTEAFHWIKPIYSKTEWEAPKGTIHLWDGGVYDNLGLESIFKPENGGALSEGLDSMIISNASPPIELYHRQTGVSARNLKRLLDISMDQVGAIRTRMIMDFLNRTGQGMYVKIGNSATKIAEQSNCQESLKNRLIERCLSDGPVDRALNYPTTLRKPTELDYHILLRHGFEVTDCTYRCYRSKIK